MGGTPNQLLVRVETDEGIDGVGEAGVDFDEGLAASQRFKFSESPHLRRDDGSYTNW